MRPIWSGSLSFGLVNIPIRVYPASDERSIEFDMLHKKDLSPIRYARICKRDGKEIPYDDIVKGFEFRKGEYIVIEDKDFKKINPRKTQTIDIHNFTTIDLINPLYFEKPYYLEPDKKASKAYLLLSEALIMARKVAVASFVFRNREHIGIIQPFEHGLLLIQLRYFSEIRSLDSLQLPKKERVEKKEIDSAVKLIEQLTESFKPEKYKDTFTEELKEIIEAKLKGKKTHKITRPQKYNRHAADLMDLLQESLKKSISSTKGKKHPIYTIGSPALKKGIKKRKAA